MKRKNNKIKSTGEWIVFEEMFKVNPQTATSYAAYLDKDYLGKYFSYFNDQA